MSKKVAESGSAALMTLIAERAPTLRAAGVTAVTVHPDGAFSATFAPFERAPTAAPTTEKPQAPKSYANPLLDPNSYPGGQVPGFTLDNDARVPR